MLITFSSPDRAHISDAITSAVRRVNLSNKIYGSVLWKGPTSCRFQLLILDDAQPGKSKAASSQAHEAFIRAVFRQDPQASIRTARAIYRNQADYLKQKESKS